MIRTIDQGVVMRAIVVMVLLGATVTCALMIGVQ